MLIYHLRKLNEYLEIRISCFELFEKDKLKVKLISLNETLKNITSDKRIENCYLEIINNQIKILECFLKIPELEFESIIMKIISNILKSTPIEISNKIVFENNVKCHIMQLDFITKRDIYIDIIDALDNLNEYEKK